MDLDDRPLPKREASTQYLRVPIEDWTQVKVGAKTAFRTPATRPVPTTVWRQELPTPVVAYAGNRVVGNDYVLMVLEGYRMEPVFECVSDPEAIAREGFPSQDHFRRYWRKRRNGVYDPMEMVHVWEIRPWEEDDFATMGARLLEELYGEFYAGVRSRQLQG